MKKKSVIITLLNLLAVLWLGLASTSNAMADGHYRLGTLNESVHYRNNDEYNSSHDGVYLVHKRNVFGTYYNSENEQSLFYARSKPINSTLSFSYGVAFGYELGVMPMLGLSAQLNIFKVTLTQEAAVIGLEFPLL